VTNTIRTLVIAFAAACNNSHHSQPVDAPADGTSIDAPVAGNGLGTVTNAMTVTCPAGAPGGATCTQVTVSGCPGIATESINATLAVLAQTGTLKGTIVHFSGGGGTGFQGAGASNYQSAGFQQVFVSWASAWEQTQSNGILVAGCRPSTILKYAFDAPAIQNGSRATAFCGEGFSGGSGQLGYALAHYGLGDYLDYVNELSGPPFARIDLGCDISQPPTATVCGATDTMRLPTALLNPWENTTTCGMANAPAADIAKWMNDSISIGGVYAYPKTRVEFFDCTNQSTAVTAMAQIYYDQIVAAEGASASTAYHCYTQADGCMGEALGTGAAAAVSAMIAGCTPRHQ
jgi:hypothetical protein